MTLYDSDFYAWTQDQAGRLRRLAGQRSNVDLDLENLAEEVESMGSEQAHAVESALVRIIEHLLKLEHSPAPEPRNGWRRTVRVQRAHVEKRLKRNPSLARAETLAELAADAWKIARRITVAALDDEGEDAAALAIPGECPYTVEQLLGDEWWPPAID